MVYYCKNRLAEQGYLCPQEEQVGWVRLYFQSGRTGRLGGAVFAIRWGCLCHLAGLPLSAVGLYWPSGGAVFATRKNRQAVCLASEIH